MKCLLEADITGHFPFDMKHAAGKRGLGSSFRHPYSRMCRVDGRRHCGIALKMATVVHAEYQNNSLTFLKGSIELILISWGCCPNAISNGNIHMVCIAAFYDKITDTLFALRARREGSTGRIQLPGLPLVQVGGRLRHETRVHIGLSRERTSRMVKELTEAPPNVRWQFLTVTTSVHGQIVIERVHEVGGGREMKV